MNQKNNEEIKKEKIEKLSLIFSLIGIFLLILLTNLNSGEIKKINEISEKDFNQKVTIQGRIISSKTYDNNFQVLTIQDNTGKIDITINSKTKINQTQQSLQITGKITEFDNNLQMQADVIRFGDN